jgi:ADP-ribosylglycohydrolase
MVTRARGCLLGLAAGDALGRPAENLVPAEIVRRWGRLTEIEPGRGGTDDTEYSIFAAMLLCRHGSALTSELVAGAYREEIIPSIEGPMRGAGFSELGTIQALRREFQPPLTGLWHPHGWSDGLAMRAAPYGIYAAGEPAEAARLVAVDGAVSHAGEGLLGGRFVAAAVAVAMTGAEPGEVAEAGLRAVPEDSWTARSARAAVEVVRAGGGVRDLHDAVVSRDYPWTDLAPEAVALALAAYLMGGGDVEESVVSAANFGRDADTTAAIAGALAGAGRGEAGVPRRWAAEIGPVAGTCLPVVAGRHVLDVAVDLVGAREAALDRVRDEPERI